jgi:hypothetical protein
LRADQDPETIPTPMARFAALFTPGSGRMLAGFLGMKAG